MSDKIKENEKMNENEEMKAVNEENLEKVVGGGVVDKIKEKFQRLKMSKEEQDEINSLINEYHSLNRWVQRRLVVTAYGGPSWFDENGKARKRLEEIRNKLKAYAKKYPNIPELKYFG